MVAGDLEHPKPQSDLELVAERAVKIGYKARATQIRADAENISNPEIKQALLRIADSYEHLARRLSKG